MSNDKSAIARLPEHHELEHHREYEGQAAVPPKKERVMVRTSALILGLAVSIALAAISSNSAFSQALERPKLSIGNIIFNAPQDGFYDVNVNLYVRRTDNPQINFSVLIQHVRSLDEVYDKLKPAVDQLADELRKAEFNRPNILNDPNILKNPNILK